jgi:hypothetical protein
MILLAGLLAAGPSAADAGSRRPEQVIIEATELTAWPPSKGAAKNCKA